MIQTGLVVAAGDGKATVRIVRSDACGKCNACFSFGKNEADIELDDPIGVAPGDRVRIELHGKSVFRASLLMYGIPLVALIAGVLIGSIWGDLYAAICGVALAAGTFFIFRALEPKLSRMSTFKPRIIEAVDNNEGGQDNEQCEERDGV